MSTKAIKEGSIVFVEQKPHYHAGMAKAGQVQHHVVDMGSLNAYISSTTDKPLDARTVTCVQNANRCAFGIETDFNWSLDGVVNNSETTARPAVESSAVLTNVAVQGPCRLINDDTQRCERKKAHAGSIVYVGLWKRIYVSYPLSKGSSLEKKWKDLVKNVDDPVSRDELKKQLRCSEYVSSFSSAQLTSGEVKLSTKLSDFAYSEFVDSDGAPKPLVPFLMSHFLTTYHLRGSSLFTETGTKSNPAKPYFGKGNRDGMWGFDVLVDLWKLGSTMDGNQAGPGLRGGMLTINVNVEHISPYSSTDLDKMDTGMFMEGPFGFYHPLRVGIGGSTISETEFLDRQLVGGLKMADIVNKGKITALENLMTTSPDEYTDEKKEVLTAIVRTKYSRSKLRAELLGLTLSELTAMIEGTDADSRIKRDAHIKKHLVTDADKRNLLRCVCADDGTKSKYGTGPSLSPCEEVVRAGWRAAELRGEIALVTDRLSLTRFLVDRWVVNS